MRLGVGSFHLVNCNCKAGPELSPYAAWLRAISLSTLPDFIDSIHGDPDSTVRSVCPLHFLALLIPSTGTAGPT